MAALDERARQALGIDGEARSVRAIVGKDGEDFHKSGEIITQESGAF